MSGERLQATRDGCAKFFQEKDSSLRKHRPYLVRWGRELRLFVQGHGGYTFEQTLDMFPAEIGKRGDVKPWQIQHPAAPARPSAACAERTPQPARPGARNASGRGAD